MSALLVTVLEAAHVGFALFARKLILCSELIAIVGMVGWSIDARVGLSLWPRRSHGLSRWSALLAASATAVVVLYVAFVRDVAELGSNPSFWRYGSMCLVVMAVITACGALWTFWHRGDFDLVGLVSVWGITTLGIACLNEGVRFGGALLEPVGRLFRVEASVCAYHGLATALTAGSALALSLRLIRTKGRLTSLRPWDLFLVVALLALVQGALAYRGVSAIYILSAPVALAWRAGWRVQLALSEGSFLAKFSSAASPRRAGSTAVTEAQ